MTGILWKMGIFTRLKKRGEFILWHPLFVSSHFAADNMNNTEKLLAGDWQINPKHCSRGIDKSPALHHGSDLAIRTEHTRAEPGNTEKLLAGIGKSIRNIARGGLTNPPHCTTVRIWQSEPSIRGPNRATRKSCSRGLANQSETLLAGD